MLHVHKIDDDYVFSDDKPITDNDLCVAKYIDGNVKVIPPADVLDSNITEVNRLFIRGCDVGFVGVVDKRGVYDIRPKTKNQLDIIYENRLTCYVEYIDDNPVLYKKKILILVKN